MSELEQRWRLVLGKYSERRLPQPQQPSVDSALAFLYDRLYAERGLRGDPSGPEGDSKGRDDDRNAGLGDSAPTVVDWLDTINQLFPEEVCQELTSEAVDRFGLTEILATPEALERITPDVDLLRLVLSMKSAIQPTALIAVRRIIAKVVDELTERLRTELHSVLTGRVNPQSRTRRPVGPVDAVRTIETNLGTWDPDRQRLLIEDVVFFRRSRLRYPWDIILCIDQSGSMAGSVIHSAIMAGILNGLPGVSVKVVVFDTSVVDLTGMSDDPVEMLMSVQLGGGTDIGSALTYCEQLVDNPTRTIVALITDFYEGGPRDLLINSVQRLAESGVTLMGLSALEDGAGPAFDQNTAERCVDAGMPVAAMTPRSFAQWAAEVMQ